jgi:hypothetical protein
MQDILAAALEVVVVQADQMILPTTFHGVRSLWRPIAGIFSTMDQDLIFWCRARPHIDEVCDLLARETRATNASFL